MKITNVQAREIFDSRGYPTVECQITLQNDHSVIASVPSGLSKGSHEALELRDGGSRLFGKGVLKSVEYIEQIIGPELLGKFPDLLTMDQHINELDGTPNKSRLGANTTLAVSIAIARAQALAENLELYELLAHLYNMETVTLPYPLFNMFNGGVHATTGLCIQEFMIMPIAGTNFRQAMESAIIFHHELKSLLLKAGKSTALGDEGGFISSFSTEIEALDFLVEAMAKIGVGDLFRIALDVAASQFYNPQTQCYEWHGDFLTAEDLIEMYARLIQSYPIYSIEDGLDQDDWQGWKKMTAYLGDKVQLAGDDLFVTSVQRIQYGGSMNAANAVVIKPNQVGTVTQTLLALQASYEQQMNTIISHRSGETDDTFIADLAVAASAGQIKAGGCSRLAKYNRLLHIEDHLMSRFLMDF